MEKRYYQKEFETMPVEDIKKLQSEKLVKQVKHVYENVPYYRNLMEEKGVGREIASAPSVLMAAYPVRGLDINSSYLIYDLLNQQKEQGTAVIFVGEDLDVLMELCDRILVIGGGRITGVVDGRTATKEEIGLLMTKHDGGESHVN